MISAHNFEDMYATMGLDVDELGCIMLDVDGSSIPNIVEQENLYYSTDLKKFWLKGFVAGVNPHVTLLYGLLVDGNAWKHYVDSVLAGWEMPEVTISHVGYFDNPEDDYYCIVAHIAITPQLLEGHQRLQLLPHIDTFLGYKAHLTLAYIKKNTLLRNITIAKYDELLKGKTLPVTKLNYGGKP